MAVTFAITIPGPGKPQTQVGHHRQVVANIVATGTYTDGGDALTPARFGLQKITLFLADTNESTVTAGSGVGWVPKYDYTNQKLKFYTAPGTTGATHGMAEASGATITTATGGDFRALVVGY